ncbi:MAG TPA: Do family serine endopeptidase [Thermohalobaculum sp.]|nr:Do family serine endopeptidase [Thermohalobaculum sp.]
MIFARTVGALMLALGAALAAVGAAPAQRVPESPSEIQLSYVPVVKKAAPAVVNIYTRKVVERSFSPFAGDPFFERMFGDLFPEMTRRRIENSLGSGVIVDPSGIVVSNHHVVGGADEITVVLHDRREFQGRVILADEQTDLAVVALEGARDLPSLELRDSDTLEVGELVLAIGNPFGVGQTVTSGIISALARSAGADRGRSGRVAPGYFIQTDAAINPGNSGGALVDMAGRLVGVNTAILSRTGGSIGIGFAVPANLVERVVAAARRGAKALDRPWLGIAGQPVTGEIAEALGIARPAGVLVSQIHPESPLARAGMRAGDILLAVEGEEINGPSELSFRAATLGTGRSATVRYLRDGRVREANVALGPAPERPPRERTALREPAPLRGLTVVNVNPAVIAELDLPLSAGGVLVAGADGAARGSGLRPGDLIRGVDGRPVASVDELRRALRRAGRPVLEVERGGRRGQIRLGG